MKKLILFFLALTWATTILAQVDLPTTCYSLEWNYLAQDWDSLYRNEYTYTFAGGEAKVSQRTQALYYASVWNPQERHHYSYTSTGLLAQQEVDVWDVNAWQDAARYTLTYDANGLWLDNIREQYNGSGYDSIFHFRNRVTYNAQNQPTKITMQSRDFFQGTWTNEQREFRTYYPNNEMSQSELEVWMGAWQKTGLNRDYTWLDYSQGLESEYFSDRWDSQLSAYRPDGEYNFIYTDGFGSYIQTFQGYDSTTATYDSTQKWVYVFDQHGNKLLEENFYFDTANNSFGYVRGDRWTLTYNASGAVVEELYEYRLDSLAPWIPISRKTCQDFVVGAAEAVETGLIVQWAPHPAGQEATLLVEAEQPGKMQVELLDVQGKLLREFELLQGAGQQGHELKLDLSAGLYLYRVNLNGKANAGRLLVR